jgi:hypothetical protein
MALQDAGSYHMLFDNCSSLCSTIVGGSPTSTLDAAYNLALLLSECKTCAILLTEGGGGALTAILEAVSSVSEPSQLDLDRILGIHKNNDSAKNECSTPYEKNDGGNHFDDMDRASHRRRVRQYEFEAEATRQQPTRWHFFWGQR